MSLSPNMNLSIPSVGVTDGPEWASELNASLNIVDAHDHTTGNGVPITPSAMDINADLSFNNFNILALHYAQFTAQSAPLTGTDFIYTSGVDLYFNDGNGNQVRITQSGGVAGSPGSISNLTAPASAAYVSADATFVWESDSNTAANMDCGAVIMRNITASSFGLTLQPPTLASNYSITLPALPASSKFMSIDNTGVVGSSWGVDNSTLEVSGNSVQVKNAGITRPKLAALGQQVSSSCGTFANSGTILDVTNLTVTITTSGRPVQLSVQSDGTGVSSNFEVFTGTTFTATGVWAIQRGGVDIANGSMLYKPAASGNIGASVQYPVSSINHVDVVGAGTYTYQVRAGLAAAGSSRSIDVINAVLVAYEIG